MKLKVYRVLIAEGFYESQCKNVMLGIRDMGARIYWVKNEKRAVVEKVRELRPHMVILNRGMPHWDWEDIIKLFLATPHFVNQPLFFCTAARINGYVATHLNNMNAKRWYTWPGQEARLLRHIGYCLQRKYPYVYMASAWEERLLNEIRALLLAFPIDTSLRGYAYLQTAILHGLIYPHRLGQFTKQLYPKAGAVYGATDTQVERCIREVLKKSWRNVDRQMAERFFPPAARTKKIKKQGEVYPTSHQFITTLTNHLARGLDLAGENIPAAVRREEAVFDRRKRGRFSRRQICLERLETLIYSDRYYRKDTEHFDPY